MTTSHDATLQARTDALASALELAGPRLDGATARRVGAAVEGVRQRLALASTTPSSRSPAAPGRASPACSTRCPA